MFPVDVCSIPVPTKIRPGKSLEIALVDKGFGRIAQLVEQLTLNQRVVGSNPTAPTNKIKDLAPNYRAWRGEKVTLQVTALPRRSYLEPSWIAPRSPTIVSGYRATRRGRAWGSADASRRG